MLNLLAPFKMYAIVGTIILVAVMLGVHLYADNRLRSQRDTAIRELNDFKTAIKLETKAREAENANKRLAGNAKIQLLQVEHESALKQRDLDRTKSTQAIKEFYENRLNINNFNHAERLRINAERGRLGLPKAPEAAEGLTESGRDCDTAFATLEQACTITTLDYNLCRATLDLDTEMVGRDE